MSVLTTWIKDHKNIGGILCVFALWVCVLTGIPCTFLEAFAGYYFGFGYGMLISTAGTAVGSALAFGLGRACGARLGTRLMARYPLVLALHHIFAASTTNYRVLVCVQLAFVPLTLKCYALSVLGVPFAPFLATNVVCGLPLGAFWAYVGSVSRNVNALVSSGAVSRDHVIVLALSGVFSFLGLSLIWYYTRRELRAMEASMRSNADTVATSPSSTTMLPVAPLELESFTSFPPGDPSTAPLELQSFTSSAPGDPSGADGFG
ncbi:hypothetical protein ACHHYP_06137 [Achlya hypogyna]|uniref:VTT domain-containing protein n=1 Tax=Achlya hypogyna TaxID=1202772 RepID=A0A1V9YVF2_ACHHY|nr:hypothetical protein ACHHYP_06137 [Achlya hypogyna]